MIDAIYSNAMNNFQSACVYFPQAVIDSQPVIKRTFGDKAVAIETVDRNEVREAMESYARLTDWSAFRRADWEAAMAAL